MSKTLNSCIILAALFLNLFLINTNKSHAGNYQKSGQASFLAHGAWQKVTITAAPNVEWTVGEGVDSRAVSITGYAVWEATGNYGLNVCEGNTYNADAVFLVVPPGLPRITSVHNPLMHQEGIFVKTVEAYGTTVTVETWIGLPR